MHTWVPEGTFFCKNSKLRGSEKEETKKETCGGKKEKKGWGPLKSVVNHPAAF